MKTIITITIENPSEETLKALLRGNAEKQTATISTNYSKKVKKHSKPSPLKGRKASVSSKICKECGCAFIPNSNRQETCFICKDKKPNTSIETIDEVINEIEERRKLRESQPYQLTN